MKLKKKGSVLALILAAFALAASGAYADGGAALSPAATLEAGMQSILNVRSLGRDTTQLPTAQRQRIFNWYAQLVASHGMTISRPGACLASLMNPDPRFSLEPGASQLPLAAGDSCAPTAMSGGHGGVGGAAELDSGHGGAG